MNKNIALPHAVDAEVKRFLRVDRGTKAGSV